MSKQQSGVNNAWDYSKPSVEDYGWHTTERDAVLIRSLKDEIERLREALGNVSRMKVFPDAQTNQFTLATAIQIACAALGEGKE